MQEIKCPNCGQVFQVDETGYAQIVQQIRDKEFEMELDRREAELAEKKNNDLRMLRMEQEQILKDTVSDKEAELTKQKNETERLRLEKEREIESLRAEFKEEISRLNAQIEKSDTEKELAVTKAIQTKDKELFDANAEVTRLKGELELQERESKLSEARIAEQHKGELKLRDEEIER